jgi:hypothetical protein
MVKPARRRTMVPLHVSTALGSGYRIGLALERKNEAGRLVTRGGIGYHGDAFFDRDLLDST